MSPLSLSSSRVFPRLTSDNFTCCHTAAHSTHETERGDHDFCLRQSHYTDTDPTSRERAATAAIEPSTSSPGVARSTDRATSPPPPPPEREKEKERESERERETEREYTSAIIHTRVLARTSQLDSSTKPAITII